MAEEKLKAFRWLGEIPSLCKGVLTIKRKDGKVIVVPPHNPGAGITKSCIVRDIENLAALGEARIEELVKTGRAEFIKMADGLMDFLHPEPKMDPASANPDEATHPLADIKAGQETAQAASTASDAAFAAAGLLLDKSGKPIPKGQEALSSPASAARTMSDVVTATVSPVPVAPAPETKAGPK